MRLRISSAVRQVGAFSLSEPRRPRWFFAEPDCSDLQLVSDGKHLAFLTPLGFGKVGVALMHLTTGKYEPREGHGFQNEKNRIALYRRLVAFFERHLAPAPAGNAGGKGAKGPALPANSDK